MSRRINKWFADLQAKRWVKSYYNDLTKQNKAITDFNVAEKAKERAYAQAYVDKLNANRSYQGNDKNSPDWSLWTVSNYAKWWWGWYTWLWFNMWDHLNPWQKWYQAQQDRLDNYIVSRPEYTTSWRYRWISWYEIWWVHAKHKNAISDKWKWLSNSDKQAAELYNLYFDKNTWKMAQFVDSVKPSLPWWKDSGRMWLWAKDIIKNKMTKKMIIPAYDPSTNWTAQLHWWSASVRSKALSESKPKHILSSFWNPYDNNNDNRKKLLWKLIK